MQFFIGMIFVLIAFTYIQPAPPYLPNLGNTCYMNAMLQNVFNLPEFNDFLFKHHELYAQDDFVSAYLDLLKNQQFKSGKRIVSRDAQERFYTYVDSCLVCNITDKPRVECRKPSYTQQDATEFFGKFLINVTDKFPKDLDKIPDSAKRAFVSIYVAIIDCVTKNYQLKREGIQIMQPLPTQSFLGKNYNSLSECLKAYFSAETVEYKIDNKLPIIECQKYFRIKYLSDYVFFYLNRFAFDVSTLSQKKLTHSIQIPSSIDLGHYYETPVKQEYDLIGVVIHYGSTTSSGHYIAYIKDQYDPLQNWYVCDDLKPSIVLLGKDLPLYAQQDIDKNAYMLFYKRGDAAKVDHFGLDNSLKKLAKELHVLARGV